MHPPSLANLRYVCNHHFWDSLTSEPQAYWLGFVAADGSVCDNSLAISLQRRDRDHLLRFLSALDSTHPVHDRTPSVRGMVNGTYEISTVYIRSFPLTTALAAWGIKPSKSFNLQWPSAMDPNLLRHFLRGYFDGDGYCTSSLSGRAVTRSPTIGWTTNRVFAAGAQAFLMAQCALQQTKLDVPNPPEQRTVTLRYGGRLQVSRIFHLLYDGATIWLPRKRAAVERYVI